MNDLGITLHFFEEHGIRTVTIEGDPWFVGMDVAEALGYLEPRKAISRHCKGGMNHPILTAGGIQSMTIIPERDIYRLIMRSTLPSAEVFEDWVVGEVIPSIRKNGGYIAGQELDSDPAVIVAKALKVADSVIRDHAAKLEQAHSVIEQQKPAVDFAKRIASADKGIKIGLFAKSVDLGPNVLFRALRNMGILMAGGDNRNVPYQEYITRGYFAVRQSTYEANDETRISQTTLITGKGEQWLTGRLIQEGILRGTASSA